MPHDPPLLLSRITANSVQIAMKSSFAALLLLLQLQPLFGTVACLGLSDRTSQPGCEMPERGPQPHSTVAQADSPTTNCALAGVCAPSPLAIVGLAESLESVVAFYSRSSVMLAPALFGISSAPPFHPPRA